MTIPVIKIKVRRKSVVKGKALVKFPASVIATNGIQVDRSDGTYTFQLDYSSLNALSSYDPTQKYIAVYDASVGWNVVTLASIINGGALATRVITAAGAVTVANADGLILLNKTVGAATTVNLPAASAKVGPLKLVDWKGDAGTNNITIVPNGSEKIQGLSQWVLGADNASIVLNPVPGLGYVV